MELTIASNNKEQDYFIHSKLLRCKNSRWNCPASFEAFIYKKEQIPDFASEIKRLSSLSWSFTKYFRPYKLLENNQIDKNQKWDDYICVLLNTQPVLRWPNIELEYLMNQDLISRLISGICIEIELPLTFYAARVFYDVNKKKYNPYWMPIEGYSDQEEMLTPPLYNYFCETYRKIELYKLKNEFDQQGIGPGNCDISYYKKFSFESVEKELCSDKPEPACLNKDWNHCPKYISTRFDKDACYNSDRDIIKQIEDKWQNGDTNYENKYKCHAGFTETAWPITVHGYLVGVAMMGQIFSDPKDLTEVKKFLESKRVAKSEGIEIAWDTLTNEQINELEEAQKILVGRELYKRKNNEHKFSFILKPDEIDKKLDKLSLLLQQFEEIIESRYRDFRKNVESIFKKELLGFIEQYKTEKKFFEDEKYILHLLKRMKEFWAFKYALLLGYSVETTQISLISSTFEVNKKKVHGIPGVYLGKLTLSINIDEIHSCSGLYKSSEIEQILKNFGWLPQRLIENVFTTLHISPDKSVFLVSISVFKEIFTFVFISRDISSICCLPNPESGSVSVFCQDAILEACSEVVHDFYNLQIFHEAGIKKWRGNYIKKVNESADDILENIQKAHVCIGAKENNGKSSYGFEEFIDNIETSCQKLKELE